MRDRRASSSRSGFEALATTSAGFANTLGRLDGQVTRDEAIAHSTAIAAATALPVSADLENGFADEPAGVAKTVELAIGAGLAGCSVEDYSGAELYPAELARDRRSGRGRRGPCGRRAPRPHRARREPHPRQPRPRRHDRPPAVVPGGGRRRALRPGTRRPRRHPQRGRIGRPPGQRARVARARRRSPSWRAWG